MGSIGGFSEDSGEPLGSIKAESFVTT